MQFKKLIPFAIALSLLAGCASVPMGDAQQDASLKKFGAPQDKAAVYVYRNETMGAAIKMPVALDGKIVGDTAAKTYIYQEVNPGPHTLVSKAETDSTLNLDTVAGKIYYVWQEVKMGMWSAGSKLQLVDEQTGQAGVSESKLVAPVQ